jgi:hypothetical protein
MLTMPNERSEWTPRTVHLSAAARAGRTTRAASPAMSQEARERALDLWHAREAERRLVRRHRWIWAVIVTVLVAVIVACVAVLGGAIRIGM